MDRPFRVLFVRGGEGGVAPLAVRLQSLGWKVLHVPDARSAMNSLSDSIPDVMAAFCQCLSDDVLPLVETISNDYPHLPVILLSRPDTLNSGVSPLRRHTFEFVEYPGDPDVIVGAIITAGARARHHEVLRDNDEKYRSMTEEALRRRDSILDAVSYVAERFLRGGSWPESLPDVLQALGLAAAVSRAYIFENHISREGAVLASQRCEWAAPDVKSMMDNGVLQNLDLRRAGFGRWVRILSEGGVIYGHVRSFPVEEQALLFDQGILSLAVVPVFVGGQWWGFFGFDECVVEREWYGAEIDALKAAAGILGAAIQRRLDEEALRKSEGRFRAIFNGSSIGVCILNNQGRLVSSNPAFCRMLGYGEDELHNMNYAQFIHSEDVEKNRSLFWNLQAGDIDRYFLESRMIRKDMTFIWARMNVSLFPGASGSADFVIVMAEDITEQKRSREALRRSEERHRAILETLPDMMFIQQSDGTFVDFHAGSPEDLYVPPRQFLGRKPADIFPPDIARAIQESITRAMSSGRMQSMEYSLLISPEEELWFEARIIRYGQDMVLTIVRNITAQKKMEEEERRLREQMLQVHKMKSLSELAGGVAHDFNNLLMGILGNADLAQMELARMAVPSGNSVHENLRQIMRATRRAADLTSQMLAYSGQGRLTSNAQDLSLIMKEMAHLLEAFVSPRVSLRFNLPENLPLVNADVSQISQMTVSLVTNSSEAIGDRPGAISVTTGAIEADREYLSSMYIDDNLPAGPYIFLEVADTGCGMDDATRERMFDPFFSTKFPGRGLGLAALLGIVRGHGGAVHVQSRSGLGTTIRILFPAIERRAEPRPSRPSLDTVAGHAGGAVLLVDPEQVICDLVAKALERAGYCVYPVPDAPSALKTFRAHADSIVCVILDVMRPHLGGPEILSRIRASNPNVPVIITGAAEDFNLNMQGIIPAESVQGYLKKPYDMPSLLDLLNRILSERSAMRGDASSIENPNDTPLPSRNQ